MVFHSMCSLFSFGTRKDVNFKYHNYVLLAKLFSTLSNFVKCIVGENFILLSRKHFMLLQNMETLKKVLLATFCYSATKFHYSSLHQFKY